MRLAQDTSRCAGIGINHTCERRNGCARYIALTRGDFGPWTPCESFLCTDGRDAFIEYVGEGGHRKVVDVLHGESARDVHESNSSACL